MSLIVSTHSFRGGTGKSNLTANITATLAQRGCRVGVVDTDIQSPGIHVLFGFNEAHMGRALNDYLWGRCDIRDAAHDVTAGLGHDIRGKVYLIPSSIRAGEIARVIREGYDVGLLHDGFQDLVEALKLDYLLVDTHPGLNEETLLSISVSDVLAVILRPDHQDYEGTAVTLEVARKLKVPRMLLIVNKLPSVFDPDEVRGYVESIYHCPVAGILPHSDELMALASAGVFALRYPNHPLTQRIQEIASQIAA
jgi:septum site-determining protein MinD